MGGNQTLPGLNSISAPSSAGLLWVSDPNASPQDRSFNLANLLTYLTGKPGLVSGIMAALGQALSSTPYTLAVPFPKQLFYITTGGSAFVFNLPTAVSALGSGAVTIIKADSGAGAVQIAPNGTDVIANAGNVSCYLGAQWQSLTLEATASGQWSVVGGQFNPHQTVDTDGAQYHLGKLHHLPLGNTTSRAVVDGANAPTPAGTFSAAIQVTGNAGVPAGAKGIRAKVSIIPTTTGAGLYNVIILFSDNNSNMPTLKSSHALATNQGYNSVASVVYPSITEIDIPLNSSGQFYSTLSAAGAESSHTISGAVYTVAVVGYYMGD